MSPRAGPVGGGRSGKRVQGPGPTAHKKRISEATTGGCGDRAIEVHECAAVLTPLALLGTYPVPMGAGVWGKRTGGLSGRHRAPRPGTAAQSNPQSTTAFGHKEREVRMEPFIGQIMFFAGNFAPRGWALCDGTLLAIAQNQALFAVIGTIYGGDGRTTFALPDLRGRVPVHPGHGPGLSSYRLGQRGGAETTSLLANNLPAHSHALAAAAKPADEDIAAGNVLANAELYASGTANTALGASSIGLTGEGQPINNLQPFECINAIIALQGIFPPRD